MTESQQNAAFEAFERAVKIAGSQTAFAGHVGCTPANISQLLGKRAVLSSRFVLAAERHTGISRHDLRPDLYPREESASHGSGDPVEGLAA